MNFIPPYEMKLCSAEMNSFNKRQAIIGIENFNELNLTFSVTNRWIRLIGFNAHYRIQGTIKDPMHPTESNAPYRIQRTLQDPTHTTGFNAPYRIQRTMQASTHPTGFNATYRFQRTLQDPTHPTGSNAPYRIQHTL